MSKLGSIEKIMLSKENLMVMMTSLIARTITMLMMMIVISLGLMTMTRRA